MIDLAILHSKVPSSLVFKCIDDVPVVAPHNSGWVAKFFSSYVSICRRASIGLAPFDVGDDKAFIGKKCGVILGVLFDTEKMTWGFAGDKNARFVHFILKALSSDHISAKELDSLAGKCIYMSDLFVAGKYHKEEMIKLKNTFAEAPRDARVPLTPRLKKDLAFWLLIAKATHYGLPISMRSPCAPIYSLVYWTDAAGPSSKSDNGLGCVRFASEDDCLPPFVFYFKWPECIQEKLISVSMTALELLAALLSIICDIKSITNRSVLFRIDNIGATRIWHKGYSTSDPLSSTIVKAMFDIAVSVNAVVYCRHVTRRSTLGAIMADDFSKGAWVSGLVSVLGPTVIMNGWKFPKIPMAMLEWLSNPVPDDDLGSKILMDLCSSVNPPNLLGFNVFPYQITMK